MERNNLIKDNPEQENSERKRIGKGTLLNMSIINRSIMSNLDRKNCKMKISERTI